MSPKRGNTSGVTEPPLVLFVCRKNVGASILAEGLLRHLARERFRVASAGDAPAGLVSLYALECLAVHRIDTTGLHSKAWGRFFGFGHARVDILITLCDAYAARVDWGRETGHTVKVHWPTPEPELVVGTQTDEQLAFEQVFVLLETRIRRLLALPLGRLSDLALAQHLTRIGHVS